MSKKLQDALRKKSLKKGIIKKKSIFSSMKGWKPKNKGVMIGEL
jgi:hypothetical protein